MLPQDMIDLDRYPLHDLTGSAARKLIRRCRESLDREALCCLPGFVLAPVAEAMAREGAALEPRACHYRTERHAYNVPLDPELPAEHPRNRHHRCSYKQVLNDEIPGDASLQQLYRWPALTEFVRQLLGVATLYRSACPHLALTLQMSRAGDTNGWHFDGNDFVVSVLLQAPDSGGEFEYAPYVRQVDDECYDAVARVMDDPERFAQRPRLHPGAFTLFKGDLSLHRVRPVDETVRPRIIALFSYDERRDQVFSPDYIAELRAGTG